MLMKMYIIACDMTLWRLNGKKKHACIRFSHEKLEMFA